MGICVSSTYQSNQKMKKTLNQKNRILITLLVTLLIWVHLAWDYFHGGIPTHYILHDDSLPGIPNWLGGIILPFFTYFLLYRIHKRLNTENINESLKKVGLRFFIAALLSTIISICFLNGIDIIDYIMGSILILAFVFPLYKSEFLLGWVIGSALTFGAIIPIAFGSMLCLLFFVLYKMGKGVVGLFKPKKI